MNAIPAYQIKSFTSTIRYLLFLLLCCLIAYYPLTFHLFSLKNDALNYFLPVRYQISEAISNGNAPFWSPYFNLGYPLHGDMQSGVWNPIVQLFSLFGPYTLKTLQCETLLYVYLSGIGMFFLLDHFIADRRIVLFASVSFMLCGFNSDSAQFLNWISAASFIPFVFLFYYKTLKEQSWKQAVFCAFFLYLMFVTAYPADFIILIYILFSFLVYHLFQKRDFNKKIISGILKNHIVIAICFVVLSLPAIISFYEFLKLSERGSGASFTDAMSNPFHPLLLFSYTMPLGVWKAPYVFATDPLERNAYFGLIPFIFLIAAFLIKSNNPIVRFSKWAFIITLFFSFGKWGALRSLAYYILPLMNSFRHPANAKIFTIFFACLLAAFTLGCSSANNESKKKTALFLTIGFISTVLLGTYFFQLPSFHSLATFNQEKDIQNLKAAFDHFSFADLITIELIVQIPFLIVVYLNFVKRFSVKWLVLASIINCVLHTMLFQPFTVVKKDSVASIQTILNQVQRKGYPLPNLESSLQENSKEGNNYFVEVGAVNMYNKKIGRIDYRITPSNLNTQNLFWFKEPLREKLMQYPVIYKADTALSSSNTNLINTINKKVVFIDDPLLIKMISQFKAGLSSIKPKKFIPQELVFEINNNQPGFYCLFQNYYPRWNLFIDGNKADINKCNVSFMGFMLAPGHHIVSFKYYSNDLTIAFYLSLIFTILIVFFGIIQTVKSSSPSSLY